jgi:hypothetical protein
VENKAAPDDATLADQTKNFLIRYWVIRAIPEIRGGFLNLLKRQKILDQLLSFAGQHAFGMKLNALHGIFPVP